MANIVASVTPHSAKTSTRQIAWLILAAISFIFAGHLLFFAFSLDMAPLEAAYMLDEGRVGLYGALASVLQASVSAEVWAARFFSVGCAIASLMLMGRLCERWCGDSIVGACLPAGLLLFPVSAYAFALITPFAPILLLSMLALRFATATDQRSLLYHAVIPAGFSGVVLYLDWSGVGLAAAIALVVLATHRTRLTIVAYTVSLVGVVVSLSIFFALPEGLVALPPSVETMNAMHINGIFLPYAMLWVGLVFSLSALGLSRSLRQRMGRPLVYRSVLMIVGFGAASTWIAVGSSTPASQVISLNAILGLGVLACMPMILWIRWVMPTIKSVWIWILLPVVMYSCFWVVLGPIDWAGFPYDQLPSN